MSSFGRINMICTKFEGKIDDVSSLFPFLPTVLPFV
jgi:hypothetical protein